MAAMPPDGPLRSAFKNWALNIIKSTPNHPLRFLKDPKTGTWYPNRINFPGDPSVDAGHTVSKWTGLPTYFALEDSDYNRNFNRGENRTREGDSITSRLYLLTGCRSSCALPRCMRTPTSCPVERCSGRSRWMAPGGRQPATSPSAPRPLFEPPVCPVRAAACWSSPFDPFFKMCVHHG